MGACRRRRCSPEERSAGEPHERPVLHEWLALRRRYRNDTAATGVGVEVFGRPSVLILRKRAPRASARWLKLWRAPIAYQGQAVFVGQTGRPIGGRFADVKDGERLYLDVDEARKNVIQDFLYSQGLAQLGFVRGAGIAPAEQSAKPSGGANYRSDGFRAVLFFVSSPRSFAEVKVVDWESLPRGTSVAGPTEGAPR
jgi:LssY C-terminus